jgi:hypothetical protein
MVEVDGLEPGRYDVSIKCKGGVLARERIDLAAGEVSRREYRIEPGSSVRGLAKRASGKPWSGARVTVTPIWAPTAETPMNDHGTIANCEADVEGSFDCTGLLPGDYDVGLDIGGRREQTVTLWLAQRSVEHVVLTAPPSGTVRVNVTPVGQAGPVPSLTATSVDGERFSAERDGAALVFRDLELGHYDISFGAGERSAEARIGRDGELVELWLELPPRKVLEGHVVDERGEPLPDVWVRAHPADTPAGVADATPAVLSDASGEFWLEAFVAGDLTITAAGIGGSGRLGPVRAGDRGLMVRLLPQ